MKETDYYKSGRHIKNYKQSLVLAELGKQVHKKKRIELYYLKPKTCIRCDAIIEYSKKKNSFCSQSCSASFNGIGKIHSSESKLKRSISAIGKKCPNSIPPKRLKNPNVFHKCKICGKEQFVDYIKRNRVTCGSRSCVTEASVGIRTYQNGSRKPEWYFNHYEHRNVLLEGSWEVEIAIFMDKLKIKWTRPKPINWIDLNNKKRKYYPDFYLPEYDLYLDPKNPYCMKIDKEKMQIISIKINIIYGDKDFVKSNLTKILR